MNRRGFFGKVIAGGAAAAIAHALPVDAASGSQGEGGASPLMPLPDAVQPPAVPAVVETVTSHRPFYEDRLTLLHLRGLLTPCPNCGSTQGWGGRFTSARHVACLRCGWIAWLDVIAQPCRCEDCDRSFPGTPPSAWQSATVDRVLLDAPIGRYRLREPDSAILGRPITKFEVSAYDIVYDHYIHNVTLVKAARVMCALRVADGYRSQMEAEYRRQPNGNLVITSWVPVDCFEWRLERGEAEDAVYRSDQDGRIELVSRLRDSLSQG